MSPAEKLESLGIVLPVPAKPIANYVPWVKSGSLIFVSGQLPFVNGKINHPGLAGTDVSIVDAASQARQSAINIIAHLRDACEGDLNRVHRIIKLTGFVASKSNFTDHPKIINGASDFLVEIFGDKGRHARSAVGVASLPLSACVEIEAIAEVA